MGNAESVARVSEAENLTDLANERVGGRIVFATDEWFAAADNLICDEEPRFDPDTYTTYGKEMDGWESRRKRVAGHDWAIVELGLPGEIQLLEVDTAFFTGNQAPRISVQAVELPEGTTDALRELRLQRCVGRADGGRIGLHANQQELDMAEELGSSDWDEILPMTALKPGYEATRRHILKAVNVPPRATHIRVNIYPDGGVARLRCLGLVSRKWTALDYAEGAALVDLLAVENGGAAISCSNQHYGHPKNLIRPGRGIHMGDGWETARKAGRPAVLQVGDDGLVKAPGSDWAVLRLGTVGQISVLVIDTNHFKGNFPESCEVLGCYAPYATPKVFESGGRGMHWLPVLERTKLRPNSQHRFAVPLAEKVTHVKITMYPDGGIMRVRALGRPVQEHAMRSRL